MCKDVIYSQNSDFRQKKKPKNNGIEYYSIKWGKVTK